MPSDRSSYRKIQELLSVANSARPTSEDELSSAAKKNAHVTFKTYQYDSKKDDMVLRVSARVIHNTVKTSRVLGLISNGRLTPDGRRALRATRFDVVLAERVRSVMEEGGVDLEELNEVILEGLQSTPPVLPTSGVLWEAADGDMPRGLFTQLLTLLVHCGKTESSQKRIFLHINTR